MAAALRATWCCDLPVAANDEPSDLSRSVELLRDGRAILSRCEIAFLPDGESFSVLPGKQPAQLSGIARRVKAARQARGPA